MGMTRAMTYKDPVAKGAHGVSPCVLRCWTAIISSMESLGGTRWVRAMASQAIRFHCQDQGWVPGFPETCAGPMLCVDGLLRARPYARGWWVLVWFDERGCVRWWVVAAMADTMRALVMGYVPLDEARQWDIIAAVKHAWAMKQHKPLGQGVRIDWQPMCLFKTHDRHQRLAKAVTKRHERGTTKEHIKREVSGICFMPPKQKFHKIKKPVAPYLREIRRVTKEKKRDSLAFREGQLDLVGIMAPMIRHRIRRIKKFLGIRKEGALPIHSVRDTLDALNGQVQEMNHMIQRTLDRPSMESPQGSNLVSQDLEVLREEVTILRRAMNGENSPTSGVERMKLPEPKSFDGNRDSKVLENFIWDLEHYFKVGKRRDGCKVDIAALYLSGDAKLWWRSHLDADKAMGRNPISTWEEMNVELRKQFLPNNVSWVARDKLRELRHTGSIREYVKQFMSLMLDIDGMSEQDKLYAFIAGLKPWAQTELRRQKVEDLTSAIAAAEALVDWKPRNESTDKGKEKANDKGKKRKFGKFKGNDKKFKRWNKEDSSSKIDKKDEASTSKKPKFEGGCFICKGPHLARQCPKRQQLSAILSEENNDEGAHDGGDTPPRISNMRLLNAMNTEDAGIDGLMYCKVRLDGKDLMAMFDTGASHNFIKESVARKLGLTAKPTTHTMKAVNSAAVTSVGLVKDANLEIGSWKGRVDLLAVAMDDYDLVLGIKFFKKAKAYVAPHLGGVLISDEANPCFLKGESSKSSKNTHGMLSAMQVKKGVKRGEPTFLAALVEVKEDVTMEVPNDIAAILEEYKGLMPEELPKKLPPRRAVDHAIELEPGARPPAKAPYRMGPSELAGLRKQLDGLIEAGFVRPSKAPYGAPVLFQRKADGSLRMCVDYRALNKVTVKNMYPIPRTDDLFDRLSRATYITKLDLRSGYWQVRIKDGDEPKTTCVTRYGSYEFLVMPFGLTNAPATFCNLMNDVLYEYLDRFCVVYLDDIVVYSQTLNDHVKHLRMVFDKLREHELYIKKEKCEFAQTEIMFLGHKISNGSVRMDGKKVQAILNWEEPKSIHELRSFLGLANYYRKFIKGYSDKVSPLTDLLKKGRSGNGQKGVESHLIT
ncbi:Transposon Ty3-I Gag-Pol polyprotein [Bienertia sinuspersici]